MKCIMENCDNESNNPSDFVDGVCRSCYEAGTDEKRMAEGE